VCWDDPQVETAARRFHQRIKRSLTHLPLQATASGKVAVASLVVAGTILVLVLPLIFPGVSRFPSAAYQPA
jgi:hypothetical protein